MTNVTAGLRERKKADTRRAIQEQALRLFLRRGFDATTVEDVAAAAGVSHMTVFRHFPTKEDLVMADEYDPLLAELIRSRPADETDVEKVRHALQQGLQSFDAAGRATVLARLRLILGTPALRARLWEQQSATQELIADALTGGSTDPERTLGARVAAAVSLAAFTTALVAWAESNAAQPLSDLVDRVFAVLRHELR